MNPFSESAPTVSGGLTLASPQASTSGTSINFTSIPSGVSRLVLNFVGVALSGTDNILVRIGDAGGLETTGYLSAYSVTSTGVSSGNGTTSFLIVDGNSSNILHGSLDLTLVDSSTFTWAASGQFAYSNTAAVQSVAGSKSLSATLDRISAITSGSDTFAAGKINIAYQ